MQPAPLVPWLHDQTLGRSQPHVGSPECPERIQNGLVGQVRGK